MISSPPGFESFMRGNGGCVQFSNIQALWRDVARDVVSRCCTKSVDKYDKLLSTGAKHYWEIQCVRSDDIQAVCGYKTMAVGAPPHP